MDNEEIVSSIHKELSCMQSYYLGSRRISFATNRSGNDVHVIRESLTVWSGMLLDLIDVVPKLSSETQSQLGRYRLMVYRAVIDMANSDLATSLAFLDKISTIILDSVRHCPGTFKGYQQPIRLIKQTGIESSCPRSLCDMVLYLVRTMITSEGNEEGDHGQLLRYFLMVSRFLKKLPIDRSDLEETMEIDYLQDEQRLNQVADHLASSEAQSWINDIRVLIREHVKDFKLNDPCPRHGPGRVADDDVKSIFSKYENMRYDARIDYLLRKRELGCMRDYSPWQREESSTRTAKFICVPKTWKTLRGISAEPSELQFFQQAVLFALDGYFSSSSFWRARLNLHDQTANQQLCRKGSIDQSLATIDLSKASDSVSLQLVREVFKGTEMLLWLLGTRSTHVSLPSGLTIRTLKFAPMGSSVCFPIECMIFVLIAEVARRRTLRAREYENYPQVPRVFGDDIVCDSATVPYVLDGLTQLGFLPNKEKSYWDGFYRESCGKEYWCGQDVSPLFFRAKVEHLDSQTVSYEELSSLQGLYNSLYGLGFNTARRYVLSILMGKSISMGRKKLRLTNYLVRTFDGSCETLASCLPTNFSAKISSSDALQCRVVSKLSWSRRYCRRDIEQLDEDRMMEISLHHWFIERLRSNPEREDLPENQADLYSRMPIGYEMVPSIKKVPYWFYHDVVIQ